MSKSKTPRTPSTPSPDARTVVPGREVTYHNVSTPKPGRTGTSSLKQESKPPQQRKHQRLVRVSVVLPASVELLVGTDDDDPSEDSDWKILSVRSVRCETTPRLVEESMSMNEDDFAALAAAAVRAEDEQ
jgi:hypothetical protein